MSFDLDKSIAAWRRRYEHDRAFLPEDVRELEQHVRDGVEELVAAGLSEEEAFLRVLREMGEHEEVRGAYRDVRWGKLRRAHTTTNYLLAEADMLTNYLKIAWRSIVRYRTYTFISITGLSVGLAACLGLGLFVQHKLSYDTFHANADRTYRVIHSSMPMMDRGTPQVPRGLAAALEEQFPEVERTTVLFGGGRVSLASGERSLYAEDVFATDEHFFQVFSFPLAQGNPEGILTGPGEAVLTQSLAARLFGEQNPVGEVLTIQTPRDQAEHRIVGVAADPPANSHFQFDMLLSLSDEQRRQREAGTVEWGRYDYYLYLLLHQEADDADFTDKFSAFANEWGKSFKLALQPLTDIHLHSAGMFVNNQDIAPQSDATYLYLFSTVALAILLLASVNHINLTTARFTTRAREIGVRKVVGAERRQLIAQFLSESFLLVLAAVPLALLILALAFPFVNSLLGLNLRLGLLREMIPLAGLIVLAMGFISGVYPAFILSAFHPTDILYGRTLIEGRNQRFLRYGLGIFQFAVVVTLVSSVLVVGDQLSFIQGQRLGTEGHIIEFTGYDLGTRLPAFKQELQRSPAVASVSIGILPGVGYRSGGSIGKDSVLVASLSADANYIPTVGFRLIAGQNFDPTVPGWQGVILNETAARHFNVTLDQVGTTIPMGSGQEFLRGIVADFHNHPLHVPIEPLYITRMPDEFISNPPYSPTLLVRFHQGAISSGLQQVEAIWRQFVPHRPFDFSFLDDILEQQYIAEQRLMRVSAIFSAIAIFIACLGLFGLAAFSVERRTKEIGIRKVLGASASAIVVLFSRDFLILVLAAIAIASPLAYVVMQRWLENFAYRIEVGPRVFVWAGGLALVTALIPVCYHAIKAAVADPVKSLRYE